MKRAATARAASAWREQETEKRAAAQRAAGLIRPAMVVGLGSGLIVVDHTKCSPRLGTWHSVPLEVATFGWRPEARPALAEEVYRMQHRQLPEGWDAGLPVFPADPKGLASRESAGQVLNVLARNVPWLMGGAADLAPSTKTRLTFDGAGDFEAGSYHGRNFHFGIREHAMCAMANGMSLALCVAAHEASPRRGSPPGWYPCLAGSCSSTRTRHTGTRCCPCRCAHGSPLRRAPPTAGTGCAGTGGAILGMETFGASAPIQQIQTKFGFEPGRVIEAAKDQLARWRRE